MGGTAFALITPRTLITQEKLITNTSLVEDDIYLKHDTGEFAWENIHRLKALHAGLKDADLLDSLHPLAPQKAELEWVELAHRKEYIETAKRDAESGAKALSTGHTLLSKDSYEVALWAVGGVLSACDAVMEGKTRNAFCAVRPPGHHAGRDKGMGYCIFNNAAVAARYVQKKYRVKRVLIVDWDVHHGNGTQEIFYEDGSVFYFSTHQWPWYPFTGSEDETGDGEGRGTTLNAPLPAGSGDEELIGAFETSLLPQALKFKPDFVLISAGFDSRNADPLGRFRTTDEGFKKLTRIMLRIADESAEGRLVSILEGGYSLKGLSMAVPAHVETLIRG
ncbi:MAG: histone deacetylase [Deltaproteobacteria bacterium]|nr:MAG: histone deacetylase [Deltaproteobacteria bacterium]